ncbi:hypothetical protein L226DRAFT_565410 [Lentinus tigrinus ALCF2SS1-7]|uniref:F-box domain-containing protein n=1 Tax=Lentinus tigrinus ALCF2SS1-6 TaxID=1328759 RepID=A0A5C2SMU8_9APHY|nr:hypothetical protein L227DRAFT_649802 [Lentinus tigrinus ALCF2SS1-6]RPD82897.1 hypothetical protein L226DRAFT_565410 [Lentinus tigrinus ALCF2SS1-7]
MDTNRGLSAVEKIPAEVWLQIFQDVPRSTDLHSVSVASRRFRDLTTRALHRDLVWMNGKHVAENFSVWETNEGMENSVRSLQLGRTAALDNFLHNGTSQVTPGQLQAILFARIRLFTNLSTLTFTDMSIYSGHFALIHALPQLRSLRFDHCMFHHDAAEDVNNKSLPITELTMLNIRSGSRIRTHGPPVVQIPIAAVHAWQQPVHPVHPLDPLARVLSLAVAQNLRTLTVDASADVFRLVFNASDAEARGWTVPASLEHVYIARDHTVAAWEPNQPANWGGGGHGVFPDTHLYHFCTLATNLRTVSTPLFASAQLTVAPEDLPVGLERFAAPLETAQFVAAVCDLKALGLLKCGLKGGEGLTALEDIACVRPGLKMLSMEVKAWDPEVVPAVSLHFRELRRLKVVYDSVGPDENYIVSLAPDFLANLPDLHTLEMYRLPKHGGFIPAHPKHLFDPSWGSIEEELRDILIGWNRFCPKLRKVQLVSGYIMTRAFEGATWTLQKVHRLEQVEDLEY